MPEKLYCHKIEGRQVSREEFEKARAGLEIKERFLEEGDLSRPASRFDGIEEIGGESAPDDKIEHEYGLETDYEATERKTGRKFLYIIISWPNETIYEIRPCSQE
jgi:hypothetical protein